MGGSRRNRLTEGELIAAAKSGNVHAYEDLVRLYQDIAWRTALVILRDPHDAEDAVQVAFVKAWQHLATFRTGSPFRPWILKIVANEAKNLHLSRQRRSRHIAPGADVTLVASSSLEPEVAMIVGERSAELVQAIDRLPERDRVVLYCRYVLELNEGETAAVLGCARGTVKSRLHRAIAHLRDVLQGNDRAEALQ
jgi:RNA polymerase sigma-70 factor (ECF subfamily)